MWKHIDSPVKERIPGEAVSKEGYADSFQVTIDFHEKAATVNYISYGQLWKKSLYSKYDPHVLNLKKCNMTFWTYEYIVT